ncbi:MAG: hypothetical protein Q8P80_03915 [Candidatus Levybacteria bacterium]|nr:hypothetical protein [Candidatus Levybacteria bacterium]
MKNKLYFLIWLIVLFSFIVPQKVLADEKTNKLLASSKVVVKNDIRVKVLKDFLLTYNSPLAENAQTFVEEADKNKLDWRLVASISGVESTFGHQIPYNSYNAWGWGIYGDNMITFQSYDEAIKTISKSLRKDYMDSWGAQDVYQIGRIYAASPTWAQRVEYFMEKVEDFQLNNPKNYLSLSL